MTLSVLLKLSLIIQTLFLAMVIHFSINPEGKDIYGNQGGLGFLVRNEICKHVSFVDAESEYVAWLKIRKSFQHQNDDLVIGSVYIPLTAVPVFQYR